mgnify:CR=1 FL=1
MSKRKGFEVFDGIDHNRGIVTGFKDNETIIITYTDGVFIYMPISRCEDFTPEIGQEINLWLDDKDNWITTLKEKENEN